MAVLPSGLVGWQHTLETPLWDLSLLLWSYVYLYPDFLLATSLRLVPCPQGSYSKGVLTSNHPRHKIIRDLYVTVCTWVQMDMVELGGGWGIGERLVNRMRNELWSLEKEVYSRQRGTMGTFTELEWAGCVQALGGGVRCLCGAGPWPRSRKLYRGGVFA